MKKVIVTGGAGFIGSHIVDALVERGFDVHVIDDLSSGKRGHVNVHALLHELDITDYRGITRVISGAKYVFHCAARPRVSYSIDYPMETHDINVTGTRNVLEAARHGGVSRVIYSASSSAYGEQETMPLREDMPAQPVHPYGVQKYMGELLCRMYSDVFNLSTVCLRYFNVYGPRLDPEGDYALVIGKFMMQKKEGKPLTIIGDGEQTRDFTHVSDIVRANMLARQADAFGGEVFNIGAGVPTSINELASMFGGETATLPPRLEAKHSQADNTRAKKVLGWTPTVSLKEGLKTINHD